MGKQLKKRDLLREIAVEHNALDACLAKLAPRQLTRAGVTPGGWSVKDILAHIIDWQDRNLKWYAAGERGETPALPEPGMTWRELPRLNAKIYRKHKRRSLAAICQDYRCYHDRMIALIQSLPDADLVTAKRYAWTGPTWCLSDYLRANTASHYRWAVKHLRRWLRSQGR